MRVFAHPLRLDGSGSIATVEQWSVAEAAQCALAVVATVVGERPMAPQFGIPDPAGVGVDADTLSASIGISEPDLVVTEVDIIGPGADGRQTVTMQVAWDEED